MAREDNAFTLIEVLAALLFLAILVPVLVGGLTLANRLSALSERKAVAIELAENKLNEQLIGNAWLTPSSTSGTFGTDYPGYRWELTQPAWDGDQTNLMTELKMEVFFTVQGKEHSVNLTTLVNPNAQPGGSPSPTPAASASPAK